MGAASAGGTGLKCGRTSVIVARVIVYCCKIGPKLKCCVIRNAVQGLADAGDVDVVVFMGYFINS